jgi:hypothetical protein
VNGEQEHNALKSCRIEVFVKVVVIMLFVSRQVIGRLKELGCTRQVQRRATTIVKVLQGNVSRSMIGKEPPSPSPPIAEL